MPRRHPGYEGSSDQMAGPTQFGELPAVLSLVGIWVYFLLAHGAVTALEASPFLLIGLGLGTWTLGMRLRFGPHRLMVSIGPWRRGVDLEALESIRWKKTGGGRSRGTIFVTDRHGGRVPIYVGRFARSDEWGPLLLDAAARTNATVDTHARHLLEP